MNFVSCYPVLMVRNVSETADFYRTFFDFRTSFEMDWYVSLLQRSASAHWELAIVQFDHPTVPAGYRSESQGVLINIEVEDAAAEYDRLVRGSSLPPVQELQDEAFGQRHFIVADPSGNLVDVIQAIPPQYGFVEAYTNE